MEKIIMRTLCGLVLLVACAAGNGTPINGIHENSENGCVVASTVFGGLDCGYRASATFTTGPNTWSGPSFSAGYYAIGSAGDNVYYTMVAGDGKISPSVTGDVTVSGAGAGAVISGTFILGPAARNIFTGNTSRGVESWTTLTQTLAATSVTSAIANGSGGFDYVIGLTPGNLCLTSSPSDCFTSETGSDVLNGPAGFWNAGVQPSIGITRSPIRDNNPAATTTGSFTGYSQSCTNLLDCQTGVLIWGATGASSEDPGWDNLILWVSTDGLGNVLGGKGIWTQEYLLNLGSTAYRSADNSWTASAFSFTGVVPIPAAAWLFGSALGLLSLASRRTIF